MQHINVVDYRAIHYESVPPPEFIQKSGFRVAEESIHLNSISCRNPYLPQIWRTNWQNKSM